MNRIGSTDHEGRPNVTAAAELPPAFSTAPIVHDRPVGYVRVPFMARAEKAAPLARAMNHAAREAVVDPYLAAVVLTHFWQAVADEVAAGNVVRIPGFGAFGPWLYDAPRGDRFVQPRFVASRALRNHVRGLCHPSAAKNDQMRAIQRSHHPSSQPGRGTSSTPGAMNAWREHLAAQAGYDRREEAG